MRISEFDLPPLDEGVYDESIFKAVFMAGSPGSGKSTVAAMLVSLHVHLSLKIKNQLF